MNQSIYSKSLDNSESEVNVDSNKAIQGTNFNRLSEGRATMKPAKITGLENLKLGVKKPPNESLTIDMVTKNLQLKLKQGLKLNTPTINKISNNTFMSPDRAKQSNSLKFDQIFENKR